MHQLQIVKPRDGELNGNPNWVRWVPSQVNFDNFVYQRKPEPEGVVIRDVLPFGGFRGALNKHAEAGIFKPKNPLCFQEQGRGLRKPLNNLCREIDVLAIHKQRNKPPAIQSLQKLFKAANEARSEAKARLGYGHPAHKGFFAGRACKRRAKPIEKVEALPFVLDGGINCGLVDPWWRAPVPIVIKAPTVGTEQLAIIEAEREERRRRERERRKVYDLQEQGYKVEAYMMAEALILELNKPDADACKLFAEFGDKIKASGNGNHVYYANRALTEMIKSTKFRILGHGHFSRAFLGPDGLVYKSNLNHTDKDGWFGWAVNCMIDPNPHTPRIYQIESVGDSFCAKMEVLSNVPSDYWETHIGDRYKFWGFRDNDLDTVIDAFNAREFDAMRLMKLARQTFSETGGKYDIHHENIMVRKHGDTHTIVLTDPIAYGSFTMRKFTRKLKKFKV